MNANKVYDILNNDFILPEIVDDWKKETEGYRNYLTKTYTETSIGLMFDFTAVINKVYTAVFLDNTVISKLNNEKNALLFVHHPINEYYDKNYNCILETLSLDSIEILKENQISVYNLHIPLDNFHPYSTNTTLAEALGFDIVDKFALYCGAYTGVICSTACITISELKCKMENIIGHKISMYNYGDKEIKSKKIAIVAGFGHEIDVINEILLQGINTLITGVTFKGGKSNDLHLYDERNKINLLGGTHYSTEKYALIKMCNYFKKIGLLSEFLENTPCMYDL